MKPIYPFALAMMVCAWQQAQAKTELTLKEASDQHLIRVSLTSTGLVKGLNNNGHIGKCMQYTVVNTSDQELSIKLPPGQILEAKDSAYQPMLVVESDTWNLRPKDSAKGVLNAMCADSKKKSPLRGFFYTVGAVATGLLKKFADFISLKKYHTPAAQSVLWNITNKRSISAYYLDGSSQMQQDLRDFARMELGVIINANKKDPKQIAFEENASLRIDETFKTNDSGAISVKIVSNEGVLKLTRNAGHSDGSGTVSTTFWINPGELPTGKYIIKYYINGKENYQSTVELKTEE